MKKIYLTGGHGAIGSNFFDYLKNKGYDVVRTKMNVDILNKRAIEKDVLSHSPNVLFHFAALVSSVTCDIAGRHAYMVNVVGSRNVAQVCKKYGIKMFYISTTAVYKPTSEIIDESFAIEPQTVYGKTKYGGELECKNELDESEFAIVRFCYGFSENDGGHSMINQLINGYLTGRPVILLLDPESLKDWIYVDELSRALEFMMKKSVFGAYNVSQGRPKRVKDVVEIISERGIKPIIYWRPERDYLGNHTVSSDKIRALGWTPEITLEDGIKKCIDKMKVGASR